ncbi:hypothetical protein EB118_04130 [bacterium]|nr:hypothetical protein [bacterium]
MGFLLTFSDAASKTYKEAVRTASSPAENVNLASAPATVGTISLNAKDRILLTQQSIASENGIYVFSSVGAPLIRAVDANTSKEFTPGMLVPVAEGTYADKIFELVTDGAITLGTTALNFQLALLPINLTTDVTGVLPVANGGTNRSSWTQGRVAFVDAGGTSLTEDSGLHWDNSNKRLGVGTSTPSAKLNVVNSSNQAALSVYSTGASGNTVQFFNQGTAGWTLELNSAANSAYTGASIGGYFARGTLAARAQTLANDTLLSLSGSGYTGTAPSGISASVVLAADENTSASAFGGQIVFATTLNSTTQPLPTPRMVVKNDGKVGVGTLLPSEQLEVVGNAKASVVIAPTLRAIDNTAVVADRTLIVRGGDQTSGNANGGNVLIYGGKKSGTGLAGSISFLTDNSVRMVISSTGAINLFDLTASQLLALDASKNIQSLDTTTYPSLTEISYVKNVTSAIQTQLNAKVSSVSGTSPIISSGGTTPAISIQQASSIQDGYLSAADWTTFNNKQPAGNYANDTLSNLGVTAINASLLFNLDNSFDIGADGASRPAGIYAANHVTAPTIRGRDNVNGLGQHDITVRAGSGITGNKDGGDLTLAGGTASGSGTHGEIVVQVAGSEIARFEKESVLKLSGGLKVKSLHNAVGTLDIITVALNDYYIGVDCSSAAKRVDLPSAATAEAGKVYVVKDESGDATTNNISVYPNGTDKIDGLASAEVLAVDNESITLVCNGVDGWFII